MADDRIKRASNFYTSASSVRDLRTSQEPEVKERAERPIAGLPLKQWLGDYGIFSYNSTIGACSPHSDQGPNGAGGDARAGAQGPFSSAFPLADVARVSPADVAKDASRFTGSSARFDTPGHPYSKDGALGESGPLNKPAYDAALRAQVQTANAQRALFNANRPAGDLYALGAAWNPWTALVPGASESLQAYQALKDLAAVPLTPGDARELEAGGVFGIAGRASVEGALGINGAAGPLAAPLIANLEVTDQGDFVDKKTGKPVTSVEVQWAKGENWKVPTVEGYTQARAAELSKAGLLDASWFLKEASLSKEGDTASFDFVSKDNSFVSVVAIPLDSKEDCRVVATEWLDAAYPSNPDRFHQIPGQTKDLQSRFDDFDLVLERLPAASERSKSPKLVGSSSESNVVDWIQAHVPKEQEPASGERFRVTVKLASKFPREGQDAPARYRLVVVGSTRRIDEDPQVRGPHQLPWGTLPRGEKAK